MPSCRSPAGAGFAPDLITFHSRTHPLAVLATGLAMSGWRCVPAVLPGQLSLSPVPRSVSCAETAALGSRTAPGRAEVGGPREGLERLLPIKTGSLLSGNAAGDVLDLAACWVPRGGSQDAASPGEVPGTGSFDQAGLSVPLLITGAAGVGSWLL